MSPKKSEKPSLTVPKPPLDVPALRDPEINYTYEIARGEIGVLTFEPYKSLILPYWAFRTVPIAKNSAEVLWAIFESYVGRQDLPGADMTRKFIQMGMTRAKRYANHKGGRKYGDDGKVKDKWTEEEDIDGKRKEKLEASEIFKEYWKRAVKTQEYVDLKEKWKAEKKVWEKNEGREPCKRMEIAQRTGKARDDEKRRAKGAKMELKQEDLKQEDIKQEEQIKQEND